MAKTYRRNTTGNAYTYSVAEAVKASITEDVSGWDNDGALERVERRVEAVADALGHLAELLVKIAPAGLVDATLNEIISYRFTEVEGDQ